MIQRLGIQAYTLRDLCGEGGSEQKLHAALRTLKDYGYDEIQTSGFGTIGMERYAAIVHDVGLKVVGDHGNFNLMCQDIDEVMRQHREILQTDIMGIGGMPEQYRASKETLLEFIDKVNCIAARIRPYGFKFSYHNHHFEFLRIDGNKTMMDYLVEGLDPETISFCLDTHWVQRGGGNPTTWIQKLKGRIDILHLKDMAVVGDTRDPKPQIVEIGQGNIDFDSVMEAAQSCGVKYYCVEQDSCPGDPVDSLKMSFDYIKSRYMV